jgi:hypothetical protein
MRRGAAWPLAERPSSCLTARSAVSRTDRRPHRRACMGRRAPQAPSAGTWFGVPAGTRSAWWPRISGAGPALSACPILSSIRCPVSGVRCPRVQCPRVRCPRDRRPASGCPLSGVGVRCPVSSWASGPLGIRRPLSGRSTSAVSEPGEFVKRADAASSHTAKTARSRRGHPARYPRPAGRLPESEPDARSWRRPCWANGGVGLAVVVGRSSASGRARPPGRPGGAGCAGTARR